MKRTYANGIQMIFLLIMALLFVFQCQSRKETERALYSTLEKEFVNATKDVKTSTEKSMSLFFYIHDIRKRYNKAVGIQEKCIDSLLSKMVDSAALYLSSRLFMISDPDTIIYVLNQLIYEKWGIRFVDDRFAIHYVFPELVIRKRAGNCVGISLLYLLIAEKVGFDIRGVLVPGHFFIRYNNQNVMKNIETMKKGTSFSNQWYQSRFGVNDTQLYSMKNLNSQEVAAVVTYTIGTILYNDKNYTAALPFLKNACSLFPTFIEAQGNYALVLDAIGKSGEALSQLLKIKDNYPDFKNLDNNIGALQIKCGEYDAALHTYNLLIQQYPTDPYIYYWKGVVLHRLQRDSEARIALLKAINNKPPCIEASRLLSRIEK